MAEIVSSVAFIPRSADLALFRHGSENDKARVIDAIGQGFREDGLASLFDSEILTADHLDRARKAVDWLFSFSDEELAAYEWPEIIREMGFCPFGVEKAVGTEIANANRYWHLWAIASDHDDWQIGR